MRVITYLGFTVLSIFIQFCVMDFIQEKIQLQENLGQFNVTTQKKTINVLLQNITSEPHALYYRTLINKSAKKLQTGRDKVLDRIYSNTSISAVTLGTTEIYTTTIFDVLYDENTSVTETNPTTESLFTSTEFDNVTGIIFFEAENKSSTKPNNVPKIYFSKYCGCNLLFQVCDINCCCDPDCTNDELTHFECANKDGDGLYNDGCISHLLNTDLRYGSSSLESLFCVVNTNLPAKRSIQKPNLQINFNKWKDVHQQQKIYEFKKTLYKQGDPIWLLRNGTIYYFDVATPMVNNYCTDRAPITFLKDEIIQCIVKFNDLEMFHISKTEASVVISVTEKTINSSALNCSTLHCVNWTILACDNGLCRNYNKSLNEVSCTENNCINVAFKIEYHFYYYNLTIINATIKLHIQKVFHNAIPFMSQEITVKFIMANKSLDNVVKFSGNPGYMDHLELIISNAKSNYTDNYFNSTPGNNYLILPENHNGMCIFSNTSENFIRFNLNKRIKCRYIYTHEISRRNYTSVCKHIQDDISALLGLTRNISVAPFGNPYHIKDNDWIKLQTDHEHDPVYGEYSELASKLHCYNLVNRVYFIFMFASVDGKDFLGQNKILSAKYEAVPINRSLNIEDLSLVLTIDINFIDVTKPNFYTYASSPNLNIHLPKDFFFPFPLNNDSHICNSYIVVVTLSCLLTFFK